MHAVYIHSYENIDTLAISIFFLIYQEYRSNENRATYNATWASLFIIFSHAGSCKCSMYRIQRILIITVFSHYCYEVWDLYWCHLRDPGAAVSIFYLSGYIDSLATLTIYSQYILLTRLILMSSWRSRCSLFDMLSIQDISTVWLYWYFISL